MCVYIGNGRLVQVIGTTVQGLDLNWYEHSQGMARAFAPSPPTNRAINYHGPKSDIMRIRNPLSHLSTTLSLQYPASYVPTC